MCPGVSWGNKTDPFLYSRGVSFLISSSCWIGPMPKTVTLKCVKDSFSRKGLLFAKRTFIFTKRTFLWLKLFIRIMFDV